MSGIEDFKRDFGEPMFIQVMARLYNHGEDFGTDRIPEEENQQLYYSLLNMIDYQCFLYKDAPEGLDEEKVKVFLKEHFKDIHCKPPTYIGLMAGTFNFLNEAVQQ